MKEENWNCVVLSLFLMAFFFTFGHMEIVDNIDGCRVPQLRIGVKSVLLVHELFTQFRCRPTALLFLLL